MRKAALGGLDTRAERIKFLRVFFLTACTGGGYYYGSPLPRCVLGLLLLFSDYCLARCKQWQRTASLSFVFIVGPYAEMADTRGACLALGPGSAAYSVLWLDAFVFSLIMMLSLPFFATNLTVPARHYFALVAVYLPYGYCLCTGLAPSWVASEDASGRLVCLMLLSLISSAGIFASLDQTSREYVEKERAHERYVAALSHDFGTPISAMQMAVTQLSARQAEEPSVRPLLDGMAAALEVMSTLKRKAMDVGKLHLGEPLTPERAPFDLRELIERKLPSICRYMPHNDVATDFFVSSDIGDMVVTDGSWVFMILLNLVSNAYKATQVGTVSVSARLAAGHVRIAVSDTGVGVSSAVEQNLWRAFERASRWQSGTGLGLYHVQHLALALGGR